MKKISVLLWTLFFIPLLAAQNISVESFRALENDLTANTHGNIVKDQNGETCALIKVVTTQQGFAFDGGMIGVSKVQQKVGEIWVYVPYGLKKITIAHQQLGVLRDYYFPISIEKARTYEMRLVTGQVQTVTNVKVNKQFVVFEVNPPHATLEFENELWPLDENGQATNNVPYGRYQYRVSCEDYHPTAGVVQVNGEGKAVVKVDLKPNFGWIELKAAAPDYNDAVVYLNNKNLGHLPMKTEALKSGNYQLRVVKNQYKPYVQQVTVSDNATTPVEVSLQANFAQVRFSTDAQSEIWIDGQKQGVGECVLRLEPGEYKAETRRASHQSTSQLIQIGSLDDQTIELRHPVPLYGSLEIMSSPLGANVLVDGVDKGQTPLMMNDVLIGVHQLRFEKKGYLAQSQEVQVDHNQTLSLNISLKKSSETASASKSSSTVASASGATKFEANTATNADSKAADLASGKTSKRKQRPAPNLAHKNLALYVGGHVRPNEQTLQDAGAPMLGLQAGAYVKSINLEYNYSLVPDDFLYQNYDLRLGYALGLGRRFMLTPQVGYEAFAGFSPVDGEYKTLNKGIIVAARAQMCLGKYFSLAVTPAYSLSCTGFNLHYSLVFNIPLAK